ncbi:MAG: hypothetical protein IJR14_01980 [Synergistaceae bacterium]|nr:hypothetical protein [Synergistaceae bacterium]
MARSILPKPVSPIYPVRFHSGGDTTTEAFGKHINEIKRIYELLEALDDWKIGADELKTIVDSIKHNSLPDLQGGGGGDYYHLTRAQVDKLDGAPASWELLKQHNRLNGLQGGDGSNYYHLSEEEKIKLMEIIHSGGGGSGSGITEEKISDNGYVKFGNGLILQWGRSNVTKSSSNSGGTGTVTFPIAFPVVCYAVVGSTWVNDGKLEGKNYGGSYNLFHINAWDRTKFGAATETEGVWHGCVSFIAVGR